MSQENSSNPIPMIIVAAVVIAGALWFFKDSLFPTEQPVVSRYRGRHSTASLLRCLMPAKHSPMRLLMTVKGLRMSCALKSLGVRHARPPDKSHAQSLTARL